MKQLRPPTSKRLADQVYEQLFDLILRGEIKPGQRLMSERRMAQALGISRTTVREALHKLAERGLVEHRQGAGSFVRAVRPQDESNPLLQALRGRRPTLAEILEVRLALECSGAALAAQRATAQDLELLEQSIERMRAQVETGPTSVDEDVCFHMNISYATNNVVQIQLMRSFYDLLHYGMQRLFLKVYSLPDSPRRMFAQHYEIFDRIRHRDPEGARRAMAGHLATMSEMLSGEELRAEGQLTLC